MVKRELFFKLIQNSSLFVFLPNEDIYLNFRVFICRDLYR
jgi:hypothetical protein